MAKVTIGGEEREGHLRTFARLEAAWPMIEAAQKTSREVSGDSPVAVMAKMLPIIGVTAVALGMKKADGSPDVEGLKEILGVNEMPSLAKFFAELLEESGAVPKPGELPAPGGAATPSMETSIP